MTMTVHGIIRGKLIELREDPGVAEGQEVELKLKLIRPERKWGGGIMRCAGALLDDPQWDEIMDEIHRTRNIERRTQLEPE